MTPNNDKPRASEVALVLLFILLAMAFAGGVDYQDDLERENRTLRASAARCQMIQALREEEREEARVLRFATQPEGAP